MARMAWFWLLPSLPLFGAACSVVNAPLDDSSVGGAGTGATGVGATGAGGTATGTTTGTGATGAGGTATGTTTGTGTTGGGGAGEGGGGGCGPLNTLENCGACGQPCAPENATGADCSTGSCDYASCVAPWNDCDSIRANGCESDGNTDPEHCGGCHIPCPAPSECQGGGCRAPASCLEVLAIDPSAPNGVYEVDPGGGVIDVYCDMSHGGITYEAVGLGRYDTIYAGWSLMGSSDLADPVIAQAFIWAFNTQGARFVNLAVGWSSGNCCVKGADSGSGMLSLGGHHVYPATVAGEVACSPSGGYQDAFYRFYLAENGPFSPSPLPGSYFTSYPPGTKIACSTAQNPGWFFRRY